MFRALLPLAAALVLLAGCKKKPADTPAAGDGTVDGDPNATYTVKLLKTPKKGERTEVAVTRKNESETDGKKQTNEEVIEYTETVVELPDGADRPTKFTREYRKVQKADPTTKQPKSPSYEGKTVTFEKKPFGYEATVGGKALPPAEAVPLTAPLNRPTKDADAEDALLPKGPVKVGDTWTPDADALKKLFATFPLPTDPSKVKLTGKLARAYTQDGKQWGKLVYEFETPITPGAGKGGPDLSGTAKFTLTLDAVIDGSSRDNKKTVNVVADVTVKIAGKDAKVHTEATNTETLRTLK